MPDPNVIEMETSPETLNYRQHQRDTWTKIHKQYDDYFGSALKHGATKEQAEEAAGRNVRGEVRWFVGELLCHAQGQYAAEFVTAAPREWGSRAEVLLDADPIVPDLIAHAYPVATWAEKLDMLTKQVAADDATWQGWLERMLPALQPFGVAENALNTILGVVDNVGKGVGGIGQGLGDAASGLGRALGYLPIALGIIGIGATVVALSYLASTRQTSH